MAASADVAMVAIRRPTGIFSAAGAGAGAAAGAMADGTAPGGSGGACWSAVGISVAAACGQAAGAADRLGEAGFGAAGLLAGRGLEWDPLCQVRARIT